MGLNGGVPFRGLQQCTVRSPYLFLWRSRTGTAGRSAVACTWTLGRKQNVNNGYWVVRGHYSIMPSPYNRAVLMTAVSNEDRINPLKANYCDVLRARFTTVTVVTLEREKRRVGRSAVERHSAAMLLSKSEFD